METRRWGFQDAMSCLIQASMQACFLEPSLLFGGEGGAAATCAGGHVQCPLSCRGIDQISISMNYFPFSMPTSATLPTGPAADQKAQRSKLKVHSVDHDVFIIVKHLGCRNGDKRGSWPYECDLVYLLSLFAYTTFAFLPFYQLVCQPHKLIVSLICLQIQPPDLGLEVL